MHSELSKSEAAVDLNELRSEGIVFVSARTSRALARGISYLCAGVLVKQVPSLMQLHSLYPTEVTAVSVYVMVKPWLLFMLLSCFLIGAISVVMTLLQTKFFFRVQFGESSDQESIGHRIGYFVVELLAASMFVTVLYYQGRAVTLELSNQSSEQLLLWLPRCFTYAGISMVLSAAAKYVLDRRRFFEELRHREKSIA